MACEQRQLADVELSAAAMKEDILDRDMEVSAVIKGILALPFQLNYCRIEAETCPREQDMSHCYEMKLKLTVFVVEG